MVAISSPNECYLGSTYFKLRSPVRLVNITVTPNPIVFGDTSKTNDTQFSSQFIQSHSLGGSGIFKGDVRTQFDRNWKSRAETRWPYISLPPLTIDQSNAPGDTSSCVLIMQFANEIWYCFDKKVYSYDFPTHLWDTIDHTLGATPYDWVEYNAKLYVATGAAIETRTAGGTWASIAQTAKYLCIYGNNLYALTLASGVWSLKASSDGATFGASLGDFKPGVTPNALTVYRDASGAQRLYATTNNGLYIWDGVDEWFLTDVRYPSHSSAGRHPVVFRDGRMYLKIGGMSVISLDIGSTVIVTPMGLDRDDGVPQEDYGEIVWLAADYDWLWALVDATRPDDSVDDWGSGIYGPFLAGSWGDGGGGGHTLRAWNGGWHTLWEQQSVGYPATSLGVFITAADQLVITWGTDHRAYYQTIPFGIYNARNNPDWDFAPGPISHTTPWWSFGSEAQQKRIAHVPIQARYASTTETIDVFVGRDLAEEWEYLGQVNTTGETILKINGGRGKSAIPVRHATRL
jgi:hypothetical protein